MTPYDASGQEIVSGTMITADLEKAFQMARVQARPGIIELLHPQIQAMFTGKAPQTQEEISVFNSVASRLRFRNIGPRIVLLNKIVVVSNY